ncbi:hypothetical protein [Aureispira anguillae]|uniref:Uncharacterized protein n=1 Tax=Aureispira anguillae TaxID=2864201 RepID=A0A916DWY4_9BACT|nr:hypothetical protein [Aureispira anguillae]BDS15312.1 hypothetical protein AsAng_0060960 [Aureispira anguillae]
MAKKRASKIYEEEKEQLDKRSINTLFADKEDEELMGINAALEKDKKNASSVEEEKEIKSEQTDLLKAQQKRAEAEAANKGISVPPAKAQRDPKMDKDPIEGEDLGLEENDFLLSRKVTELDLEVHNKVNREGLLGSNVRKPRDLVSIFSRGLSTNESPKIDSAYSIENNKILQKEIAAIQLLHNYHSRDNSEKNNARHLFAEIYLEEDLIEEIKADKKAYENEDLIAIIRERL